jgi:CRP-like cAMP-binding protein
MFGANQLIGLGCLSFEKRRLGTATALEPSELIRIDRDRWFKLLREQPELFEVALAHLSNRNVELQKDLCAQILDHSERRLARVLLKLTQIGVEQHEPVVSSKNLSRYTGLNGRDDPLPNHLFHELLQKTRLIDYKGSVMVHPSRLNAALQDE